MSDPRRKISLNQQIDEVRREIEARRTVYPRLVSSGKLRQAVADYQTERMEAALVTLEWLGKGEAEIRAFMSLTPEDRSAIAGHGHLVAQLARQLADKEAIAKAGGPVR